VGHQFRRGRQEQALLSLQLQQHTTSRSIKRQGSYHSVDTRSDDLSAQIYLAGWTMMSSGLPWLRSPWTSQLYLWWSEKHCDHDKAVCSARNMREEGQQSAGDHCRSEPLSIDAVRRFIVYFMAWRWTDSYRSSHLHSPHHTLFTIAGEGIFTADSRKLIIHPIAPAQAD